MIIHRHLSLQWPLRASYPHFMYLFSLYFLHNCIHHRLCYNLIFSYIPTKTDFDARPHGKQPNYLNHGVCILRLIIIFSSISNKSKEKKIFPFVAHTFIKSAHRRLNCSNVSACGQ